MPTEAGNERGTNGGGFVAHVTFLRARGGTNAIAIAITLTTDAVPSRAPNTSGHGSLEPSAANLHIPVPSALYSLLMYCSLCEDQSTHWSHRHTVSPTETKANEVPVTESTPADSNH